MVTPEVYQKNTAFPSAYQQDVARSQPRVLMNSWLIEVCKYASNAICIFVTIVCVYGDASFLKIGGEEIIED
jgi:hypothetical protein